jgi:hypothetical protein
VVCVGEEQQLEVEVCPYTLVDGIYAGKQVDLYRMRYCRRVRLVDPVTGLTVAVGTICGSQPDICHESELFSYYSSPGDNYRYGDHPDNEDLVAWMEKYLKP